MKELLEKLVLKNLSLGSVESMTAGLFVSSFADVPGASKALKGSLVTYSVEEKVKLLGMDPKVIEKRGVVSEEVAKEMARLGKKVLNVDVCVSITGNAGPTCEPGDKPVGCFYVGVAYNGLISVFSHQIDGTRDYIRHQAVLAMREDMLKTLN